MKFNSGFSWILDSGATNHMIGCSNFFSYYSPCAGNKKIKIADGSLSAIAGIGSIKISPSLTISNVLHVPNLSCNLLSISKLTCDHNCVAKFSHSHCEFQQVGSGRTIGSAREDGRLYFLEDGANSRNLVQNTCFESVSVSIDREIMLWHYRLGHPSFQYLKFTFPNLFKNKIPSSFKCEICALVKPHRTFYPPRPYKPYVPFSLIHSDVWGPSRISSISGKKWFVTFIDDYTRVS